MSAARKLPACSPAPSVPSVPSAVISRPLAPTPRPAPFTWVSEEEYFTLDLAAERKLEYYDGEIVAMAGASPNHNDITTNVGAWLHGKLRGGNCRPRIADQRVFLPERRSYVYPDVVVACGKLDYQPGTNPLALLNPVLIVEVLSPSTERNDRGRKFHAYQSIKSLLYYVLLDSEQIGADFYAREPGADLWLLRTYEDLSATLPLPALGAELPLAEAYAAVVFGEGEV